MRKILLLRRAGPTGAGRTESRASPVGPATLLTLLTLLVLRGASRRQGIV